VSDFARVRSPRPSAVEGTAGGAGRGRRAVTGQGGWDGESPGSAPPRWLGPRPAGSMTSVESEGGTSRCPCTIMWGGSSTARIRPFAPRCSGEYVGPADSSPSSSSCNVVDGASIRCRSLVAYEWYPCVYRFGSEGTPGDCFRRCRRRHHCLDRPAERRLPRQRGYLRPADTGLGNGGSCLALRRSPGLYREG